MRRPLFAIFIFVSHLGQPTIGIAALDFGSSQVSRVHVSPLSAKPWLLTS
jgi:hypothetical protein